MYIGIRGCCSKWRKTENTIRATAYREWI